MLDEQDIALWTKFEQEVGLTFDKIYAATEEEFVKLLEARDIKEIVQVIRLKTIFKKKKELLGKFNVLPLF